MPLPVCRALEVARAGQSPLLKRTVCTFLRAHDLLGAFFVRLRSEVCRFKLKLLRVGHSVSPCIMAAPMLVLYAKIPGFFFLAEHSLALFMRRFPEISFRLSTGYRELGERFLYANV